LQFSGGNLDNASTLTAGDQLGAGAGTADVLNITISGSSVNSGGYTSTPTVTGVETLRVNNVATDTSNAVTLDLSLVDNSLTSVGTYSSTASAVTTKFTNVASLVNVEMGGKGDLNVGFSSGVVSGAADSLNVTLNGVGTSSSLPSTFTTSGVETVKFTSSTSSNYVKLADTAAKTVTVSGTKSAYVDINGGSNTNLTKVDASAATGNVSINATASTGNVNLIGGTGSDTFYMGGNLTTSDTVSGGDGTADTLAVRLDGSTLTLNSSYTNISGIERVALTANGGNSTPSVVDVTGLSGITTVATGNESVLKYSFVGITALSNVADDVSIGINGYTITQDANFAGNDASNIASGLATKINADTNLKALGISATNSSGVLTLTAANGVTGVNLTALPTYSTAPTGTATGTTINDYTFNNLPANTTLEVFGGQGGNVAGTVTLDDIVTSYKDSTGTADAMTVNLVGGDSTLNYTANSIGIDSGIETLSLNSGGTLQSTSTNTITALAASATNLKSLTITGDSNLTIGGVGGTNSNLKTIDASALTGKLDITVTESSSVTLTGGTANDTLRMGSTLNNGDSIDGGSGTDILTANVGGLTSTTGALNIKNVELVKLVANADGTVDVSNISGASLISLSGAGSISATKLPAGASLGLGNDASGTSTAYSGTLTASLADATGTADTLTLVMNTTAAQTAPTVKTSGIETLNLNGGVDSSGSALSLAGQTLNLSSSDAKTVKVTASTFANSGSDTINLGTLNKATTTVDASGVSGAGFSVALGTGISSAATISGGDGLNTLVASNAISSVPVTFNVSKGFDGSDVITGGAGNDVLNATFSNTAGVTITAGAKVTAVETINYTVNGGVVAEFSNAADLNDNALKTVTVAGGNSSSQFKVSTAAFSGTAFATFDASSFAGTSNIVVAAGALDGTETFKAGSGTSDILNVNASSTALGATNTISGFEHIVVTSDHANASLSLAGATGVTNVWAKSGSADNVEFTKVPSGVTANLGSVSSQKPGATTLNDGGVLKVGLASSSGSADALTVNLNNQQAKTLGAIDIQVDGVENLTLNAISDAKVFSIKATESTNTLDQNVVLTGGKSGYFVSLASGGLNSSVKSVDASNFSGDLVMQDGARTGTGAMTVTGGAGNDVLIMKSASDVIDAGAGTDTLKVSLAAAQVVTVNLGSTADQLSVGVQAGAIQKGFENVDLSGLTGAGVGDITASSNGSVIVGSSNADIITGAAGDDVITGGAGGDIISLATGSDTVVFTANNGSDTINDFKAAATSSGGDILNFTDFADFGMGNGFVVTNANVANGTSAIVDGNVVLVVDSSWASSFSTADLNYGTGTSANDLSITNNVEAVVIVAGSTSASSAKIYYVDMDNSTAVDSGDTVTLVGTINFTSSTTNITTALTSQNFQMNYDNIINGTSGAEAIRDTAGDDLITAGGGNDTIYLTNGGSDTLVFGSALSNGTDTIYGFGTGAGNVGDILDFGAFATFSGAGFVTSDTDLVSNGMTALGSDGQVALIVNSTLASSFGTGDIITTSTAANKVGVADDIEAVVIIADSTSASSAKIYYVDMDATTGVGAGDTVTLVGTLNFSSDTNITTGLTYANFDMS